MKTEIIESTAGQIAAELARRGLAPTLPVVLTVGMSDELIPGRLASRLRVAAEGLSDEAIDKLIDEARAEVCPSEK